MPILDQFGRPLPEAPAAPIDIATVTGIAQPAQRFNGVLTGRLTPERLALTLRQAAIGDTEAYLTLAEDMEEKELHYRTVLSTRKLAVCGEDLEVTPGNKSATAQRIADEFRETVVEADGFDDLQFHLMDALGKGYSVVEPIWNTLTRPWTYERFEWHDPRFFCFDRATLKELRLKDQSSQDGQAMPAGQFVVHYPRLKTGIPIRGGLARIAAVAFCFKSFTIADWAAFCEVYGMPLRYAYYDPGVTTETEMKALRTALANIGHDAAALLPRGSEIQFVDGRRPSASGKNLFEGFANYWDAQVSKVTLGQTLTTDDGASHGQGEVHERVQVKYAIADARSLVATIRRGILRPWVYHNHGQTAVEKHLPKLRYPVEPPEDLVKFTNGLLPWVRDAGLKVSARQIRERFRMEEPDPDDDLLEVEQPDPADQNPELDPNPDARSSEKKPKKAPGGARPSQQN